MNVDSENEDDYGLDDLDFPNIDSLIKSVGSDYKFDSVDENYEDNESAEDIMQAIMKFQQPQEALLNIPPELPVYEVEQQLKQPLCDGNCSMEEVDASASARISNEQYQAINQLMILQQQQQQQQQLDDFTRSVKEYSEKLNEELDELIAKPPQLSVTERRPNGIPSLQLDNTEKGKDSKRKFQKWPSVFKGDEDVNKMEENEEDRRMYKELVEFTVECSNCNKNKSVIDIFCINGWFVCKRCAEDEEIGINYLKNAFYDNLGEISGGKFDFRNRRRYICHGRKHGIASYCFVDEKKERRVYCIFCRNLKNYANALKRNQKKLTQ